MTTLEKMAKLWFRGPGDENPSPEGPEGERVGDDSEPEIAPRRPTKKQKDLTSIPRPGAPMVPDHQTIDSNPIDPRVF